MLYPLLFTPIFQERIWGGRNLETLYAKQLPPKIPIGESWEISDRDEAQSVIANGPLAGKTLRWLMQNHERDLLGSARSTHGRFPLLVKILDAEQKLSLQVHPPPQTALHFGGEPKTELWYITHAKPGAELYVGLKQGVTRHEFEAKLQDGSVADCFHRVPVKTGDAMFLPSGRVHAIGAGLVIFEIQQNSDTTYRVFDWNRTDSSGKPRQLHVKESLECIDFHDVEPGTVSSVSTGPNLETLIQDPLFSIHLLRLTSRSSHSETLTKACVAAVSEGNAHIEGAGESVDLAQGGFCLVPASVGQMSIRTDSAAQLLLARPG